MRNGNYIPNFICQTTYIYRKDGDCSSNISNYSLIATVSGSERSYYDSIPSGVKVTYRILSKSVCGGQTYTVGDSSCVEIEASPQTGSGLGTVYFYITDHLGTVRVILDQEGNIKSTHDFEPYGVELQPLSDELTNFKYKYTGQERDDSTNLDYMHFRYYASSMGRFLKPDNIIPNAFNPQSWNLYTYVKGNPVNFNDPNGHYPAGTGGAITQSTMAQAKLPPPGGTAWERTMVQYMTFTVTDYYNVVVTKDSNGNFVSAEGTYLYSQAGTSFAGPEVCAGRAGDAQSAVLSKDDPVWPILRVILNIQTDMKVEIAFAIAKQDGVIFNFKWQAGKSKNNWGDFSEFKKWMREDVKRTFDEILGGKNYVLDVGHSHPPEATGNFSANEYRAFSWYAGTPEIDRVIVVNEHTASFYQ